MSKIKTGLLNKFKLLIFMAATFSFSGCAIAHSPVGNGLLFTSVKGPVIATSSDKKGSKMGESSAVHVLGLVAMGDASINKAKKEGNITRVTYVDHESFTVLGLFSSYTLKVYGD